MLGLIERDLGGKDASIEPSKGSALKHVSGSGECSMLSQVNQSSPVVLKPKDSELAERTGEMGDTGEPADSEVKSVPNSSA